MSEPAPPRGWAAVSVRQVWRQAARILARRPEAIIGTTALITLPYLVVRAVLWDRLGLVAEAADERAHLEIVALLRYAAEHERVLLGLLVALFLLLPWILQAALARGVVHEMRGTPISGYESLRAGLDPRRWPAVLGVALFAPLIVALMALVMSGLFGRTFATLIADLRGVLPIFWCHVFCVVPMVILEGGGWWGAMRRYGELTRLDKSSTWRAAFRPLALAGLPIFLGWAAAWGALFLFGPRPATPGQPLALLLVSSAVTLAFSAFIAVTAAVAYAELREAEERWQSLRAAEVFG